MASKDWIRPMDKLPKEGEVVNAINSVGRVHQLKHSGNFWYLPDGSMYVYFEPTFWQPIEEPQDGK